MIFNSYIFILLFLPIAVMGYYISNRYEHKNKRQNGLLWIIAISLFFYVYDIPIYLLLLLGSIVINYGIGLAITRLKQMKEKEKKQQKVFMVLGILLNLAPLLYFKYGDFFVDSIEDFFNTDWDVEVALPLGISFFTFMQITYIIDCYRSEEGFDYTLSEYVAYMVFFPKITMGPIALHSEIIPQFRDEKKKTINYENMNQGLYAFALGLAKKVLIADNLAKFVAIGYEEYRFINSMTVVMVMLCYTLQLYFDFSGYCDMAMGVAKMFNIELPYNFNSPYKARSISEFWDRWHMTLTRFFTRYVYIPLGGSRRGKLRTYGNTMIIFLLSGLWHGAEWSFIFWGLLHGIMMILERIGRDFDLGINKAKGISAKILDCLKWTVTFVVINITWVFFRAEDMEHATGFLKSLFHGGWEYHEGIMEIFSDLIEIRILKRFGLETFIEGREGIALWAVLILLVLGVVFLKNTQEKIKIDNYHWTRSVITVALIVWCVISLSDVSVFLYFNF